MTDLERAKGSLVSGGHTCVIARGDMCVMSDERGVKPLVTWYQSGADFTGSAAADKVVGRGAAFLYVLLGVRMVYATVMSVPARRVLETAGISVAYDTLVPNIINRRGDGICPFEAAVAQIHAPRIAYDTILALMREMHITP